MASCLSGETNSHAQHIDDAGLAAAVAVGSLGEVTVLEVVDIAHVGASGAVFGILLAFGMIYPNLRIMLLFPPIPMKAKWFVLVYGLLELFGGIHGSDYDNVAHWAHLGGMLFGFLLLRMWGVRRLN